jgi:hypothetical protein
MSLPVPEQTSFAVDTPNSFLKKPVLIKSPAPKKEAPDSKSPPDKAFLRPSTPPSHTKFSQRDQS